MNDDSVDIYALASSRVNYDRVTGEITWKHNGKSAQTNHSKGYFHIKVGGDKSVLAHRLAWFMVTGREPSKQIDHINRVKTDNRIKNLREVTTSENHMNKGRQSNNSSGFVGVARDTRGSKWQAYIKYQGKRIHLGVFENIIDAVAARTKAEKEYFREYAVNAS